MKVLVAHNRYRTDSPSGENTVVDAEMDLLRDHGVEVIPMIEESDSIPPGINGALRAGPGPIYSRAGVKRFRELLRDHQPDLVHLHNVFPLISPWVVRAANAHRVPVVQTVHNYRHSCVKGVHFRAGHVCTDCVSTRTNWPAVAHACYRNSRTQSVPMALAQTVHRSTWQSGVSRFVALTPFMKERLELEGIPHERIAVRPTWVPDGTHTPVHGRDILFVGRLDRGKGVDLLLRTWETIGKSTERRLRFAGDGELQARVRDAATKDRGIVYLGNLSADRVAAEMDQAALVACPSLWFEGYPLVIAEAFARGRPVLTVTGGAVASIVSTSRAGWVAAPTVEGLSTLMRSLEDQAIIQRGQRARECYERQNSESAAWRTIAEVYDSVLTEAGPRSTSRGQE